MGKEWYEQWRVERSGTSEEKNMNKMEILNMLIRLHELYLLRIKDFNSVCHFLKVEGYKYFITEIVKKKFLN